MSSPYIVAVDQSTSASKVYLLNAQGSIVKRYAKDHAQHYPHPGHVEHDAEEIWQNVLEGILAVTSKVSGICGLAISNQRETTVFWDPVTGKPVCPAIVWQDVRGEALCRERSAYAKQVKAITGLDLSAYFPAAKIAAKFREDPALLKRAEQKQLCVGTMDSYLMYRLTQGKTFACDVSNASRTQLMDLEKLAFSEELCGLFGVPMACLPEIRPSDAQFGQVAIEGLPALPITGVMGDSHASFFAQECREKGMVKATFGTGSSVMMNIGDKPLFSNLGLSTCVGYSFEGQICYVLEGNITSSGDTLRWLVEEAGMAKDLQEVEEIAKQTRDTDGVYLVPAFSGLGAPYQQPAAQALICGLNRGSKREHIVRAAMESIAYQDVDVLQAMQLDTGIGIKELRVDGGPTANQELMQFLSDIAACDVQSADQRELSALGAGIMAGRVLGVYQESSYLKKGMRYQPTQRADWRESKLSGWKKAISRARIN